ncbi:MAG: homoserine dehydrogenase [Solobacterium sp.]|nr:homoserine dehydrogenase [Solobacterium sp.]
MRIGLLGCGVVGSGVCKILDESHSKYQIKRILVKIKEECVDKRMTIDVRRILDDSNIETVIECMGGIEPAFSYVKEALSLKKHVITSNKKMLAEHYEELIALAKKNHCALRYEASVGGGIPWIHELEHLQRVDSILAFEGIFNGTTNYILSHMEEKPVSFSTVLKEAQRLGYAEQDPSDDIDGMDTRYKLAISIAKAFGQYIPYHAIPLFGIRNITKEDVANAKKEGYRIRLLAQAKKVGNEVEAYVIPTFVKEDTLFAHVKENYNAMKVTSTNLGESLYIGQGAGSLPTAHAVVQDLYSLCDPVNFALAQGKQNTKGKHTYYVRCINEDAWNSKAKKKKRKNVFLLEDVSFKTVLACFKKDPNAFVAEVRK